MADTLKITLVKSMIGRPEKHRKVLAGMGLHILPGRHTTDRGAKGRKDGRQTTVAEPQGPTERR